MLYSNMISIVVIIVVSILSFIHFYWAFGGKFEIDKIIPRYYDSPLPRQNNLNIFIIASILLFTCLFIYGLEFSEIKISDHFIIGTLWLLCVIFALRAIGEFSLMGLFKKIKYSSFGKYDTLYYTPISLFLAIYFFVMSYNKTFNW